MTSSPGTLGSLKDRNRLRIVDVLRRSGTASRVELVRATGLSRTTVSKLVGELQASGLVVERSATAGQVGRPAIALALNPRSGAVCGIDFGHDVVRAAIADLSGAVLAEHRRDFDVDDDPHGAIDVAVDLVHAALEEADTDLARTVGVGVAVSAPVVRVPDAPGGVESLPGWQELPPFEELERRLGRPVIVDNDANLGALAEVRGGAARGARNVLYVMLSGGIGSGLILDGRLVRGTRGITGELGHVVLDPNGPICRCGNRGCIETVASAPVLLAAMQPLRGAAFTLADATRAAREGDDGARRLFADAGRTVGQAVGAICNLVNPELVVVGGDMGLAGDVLVDAVRDGIALAAIPAIRDDARVIPAELGDRAEVLGAIGLVLSETETETLAVMAPTV